MLDATLQQTWARELDVCPEYESPPWTQNPQTPASLPKLRFYKGISRQAATCLYSVDYFKKKKNCFQPPCITCTGQDYVNELGHFHVQCHRAGTDRHVLNQDIIPHCASQGHKEGIRLKQSMLLVNENTGYATSGNREGPLRLCVSLLLNKKSHN